MPALSLRRKGLLCIFFFIAMPEIETHPFRPFLPSNAKLLMLGTFPPACKRWCMDWYYPNFTNDMWRILGLCFFSDSLHFVEKDIKTFRLDAIQTFMRERGIAIFDTAVRVRRTKGTASDKDLEVVEVADLDALLGSLTQCKAVLTAGQLATSIFSGHYKIDASGLKMGEYVPFRFGERTLQLYRMPSSSRAYPLKLEKKAEFYKRMFNQIGIE